MSTVEILRINTQRLKFNKLDEIQRTPCYKVKSSYQCHVNSIFISLSNDMICLDVSLLYLYFKIY